MQRAAVLILALCSLVACSGAERETGGGTQLPAAERIPVDPGTFATLRGVVRFRGEAPPRAPIQMAGDQFCVSGETFLSRSLLVDGSGGVGSAVVHVKEGVSQYAFPPTDEPVVMDQKGCLFEPRVTAVRTEQPLTLLNSDPTFHNVRATSEANKDFNLILPQQGMKEVVHFDRPEIFIPLKCDVHPWMSAQLAVLDHPCFAMSGTDGRFEIEGIPAGELLIEARHEVLGAVTQKVTLKPGETREIELVFDRLPTER